MKQKEWLGQAIVWIGVVVIALVSWHSVQEIHYLKSFYPRSFTVVEAGWAAVVELVKVTLISFPILLTIVLLRKRQG